MTAGESLTTQNQSVMREREVEGKEEKVVEGTGRERESEHRDSGTRLGAVLSEGPVEVGLV